MSQEMINNHIIQGSIMFTIETSVQLYDSAQLMSYVNLNFNYNFQAWELEPDKRPTFVEARDILEKFKIQNPQWQWY